MLMASKHDPVVNPFAQMYLLMGAYRLTREIIAAGVEDEDLAPALR